MKRILTILLVTVMMMGGFIQPAQAALSAVGPTNPENGFPIWYQDTAGLRLDLCLDQNGFCLTAEPNPALPISFPNNFGPEAFWWMAEAAFGPDNVTGMEGLLVLALEAAFAPSEVAVEGLQQAFARIRIRIDVPEPGTYTVTHPFGTATYVVAAVDVPGGGGANEINETQDLGNLATPGRQGPFNLALLDGPNPPLDGARVNANGRSIGPFLTRVGGNVTSPADNLVYLANPGVLSTVTGSPFGTNFFRVTGPTGTSETASFTLMGKLSVTQPPSVNRAEYRVKTGKFHVQGFSAATVDGAGAPAVVTIRLGTDNTAPVVGTAVVNGTTGIWSFTGKAPLSPGGPARTVAISSTADPGGAPAILGVVLR